MTRANRAAASALAAALLLSAPDAWGLRDVVSNQPVIPDQIVPGKTTLQGSGGPTDILPKDGFVMDMSRGSKVAGRDSGVLSLSSSAKEE